MELQVEDSLILLCIKLKPSLDELEQINRLIPLIRNWDYLINTIIDRGIGPLLYKKLPFLSNSSIIPESIKTKLQQVYYKTFSRSMMLYEHFRKIAGAFIVQDIPIIALKGIYLSEWLYQDIGLRQFSDIDLLVKEEDAARCINILSYLGYNSSTYGRMAEIIELQFNKDIVHYPPMILNGVSIELHIKLFSKSQSYNLLVPKLWDNAIPVKVNEVQVKALNKYDLLIHLCLHLARHFREGHVQFTCFNDITNLLEKYAEILNWNEFTKACRLYNCEDVVFEYIVMVNKYMNAAVPEEIIQKYESLLTKQDEELFCNYLRGNDASIITISFHFSHLKNIHNTSDKVRYLSGVLFPSKDFMINTYKIKRQSLILFYYPFRYYIGLMGVVNYLMKKVVGRM